MAAPKDNPGTYENPFTQMPQNAIEASREIFGWQMKTAFGALDQTLRLSQTIADSIQHQAHENLKLAQDLMKYGFGVAEDCKKNVTSWTEKYTKH